MKKVLFRFQRSTVLSTALCLSFLPSILHAAPCDPNYETCVRDKKPTTIIREQNNSPCRGCQPPPPQPNPLPSSSDDPTFRGNPPEDGKVCRRIADLRRTVARAKANADNARNQLPDLKNNVRDLNARLPLANARVVKAKANLTAGAATTASSVARCAARLQSREDCPDYDPAVSAADAELRDAEDEFKRIMEARNMYDGEIARLEQSIRDADRLTASLNRLTNTDAGKACP